MEAPIIKPIKTKEYEVPESKYKQVGKLPIRSILVGPSGSGKSILLQNMIIDIYKGLFGRIYIFSPSIDVDHTWLPVKNHIKKELKLEETDEEKFYFSEYDPNALSKIIETQKKVIEYQKKENFKKKMAILIVIDDMADDVQFSRNSRLLHALYTRGRHSCISSICSVQKYVCLSPLIRVNASELYIFRLRNNQDLTSVIDENSALVDKATLLEMYKLATREPYSFLYIKLTAKDINDMFYIKFDKKLMID